MNDVLRSAWRPTIIDVINNSGSGLAPMRLGAGYSLRRTSGVFKAEPELIAVKPAPGWQTGETAGYAFCLDATFRIKEEVDFSGRLVSSSFAKPSMNFTLKSLFMEATVRVEMSVGLGYMAWYFHEKPTIRWDLEASTALLNLPFVGENSVDDILEIVLGTVTRENPAVMEFTGSLESTAQLRSRALRRSAIDQIKKRKTGGFFRGLFG